MKPHVTVCGTIYCDLIFRELSDIPKLGEEHFCRDFTFTLGGAFNISAWLSHLGLQVSHIDVLGNDEFSDIIRRKMEKSPIDTSQIYLKDKPMPKVTAIMSLKGDRAMASILDVRAEDYQLSSLPPHGHTHFLGLEWIQHNNEIITNYSGTTSLTVGSEVIDIGYKNYKKWAQNISTIFLNKEEACALTHKVHVNEALQILKDDFNDIIITLGKDGAIAYINQNIYHQKITAVEVIDATGAGDAFAAGYIAAQIQKLPPLQCLKKACDCGTEAVKRVGVEGLLD